MCGRREADLYGVGSASLMKVGKEVAEEWDNLFLLRVMSLIAEACLMLCT